MLLEIVNLLFTGIFILEAALKLISMGKQKYINYYQDNIIPINGENIPF